jgi:alkanesulfonate monooxygenase SsuD/methylene tetrahydromethanopterin reductase-like flavin-dependent oxidoreductase (luciferase family)
MLFHNPVILAKRFATLDVLSDGRALAGLGLDWSKDEFLASNIPFEQRGRRADELIHLLKSIWSDVYHSPFKDRAQTRPKASTSNLPWWVNPEHLCQDG